jgi:hypothetical protein
MKVWGKFNTEPDFEQTWRQCGTRKYVAYWVLTRVCGSKMGIPNAELLVHILDDIVSDVETCYGTRNVNLVSRATFRDAHGQSKCGGRYK